MATPKGPDTSTWKSAGINVKHTTLDGILFIAVNVAPSVIAAAHPSKTGKSKTVGTTSGNVQVGDVKMGLNVYAPLTAPPSA